MKKFKNINKNNENNNNNNNGSKNTESKLPIRYPAYVLGTL